MKIGDTVKLVGKPGVDWMHNYLEETFEILDFSSKTGAKVKMVGTEPSWIWIIGKDNFELVNEAIS